ncbi:MAG: hypothetical protein ACOX52_09040 [Verrucomicrobiota bacterium]
MLPSNLAAKLCQHRKTTVAAPGFSYPNPITRPSILHSSCPTVTSPLSPWRSWRLGG